MTASTDAIRATARGRVQGVGYRAAVVDRARDLGVLGWVRNEDDGTVLAHAEGAAAAVVELATFLHAGPPGAEVSGVEVTEVKVEGHEQFAVRGVSAGRFVVEEQAGDAPSFVLRLEVDGAPRAWRLSKPPSMVPADKRFASQEGDVPPASDGPAPLWDEGTYEQGGRVPWPEAIERGHAVFVLHGAKLQGGFALQRTRGSGPKAGWLLIKRRDAFATSPA
jgi:acylphosphatase